MQNTVKQLHRVVLTKANIESNMEYTTKAVIIITVITKDINFRVAVGRNFMHHPFGNLDLFLQTALENVSIF